MKYEYGDIGDAKPGDIVEYQQEDRRYIHENKLHIVSAEGLVNKNSLGVIDTSGNNVWDIVHGGETLWKLIKTKPGSEAKIGDKVIFIVENIGSCEQGKTYTVRKLSRDKQHIYWSSEDSGYSRYATEFLVLCKEELKVKYYKNL